MGAALVGMIVAAVAGLMAGNASARGKRARLDYQRTKGLIPAARKLAWAESVRTVKVFAGTGVVLLVIFAVAYSLGTH
jgi:hypothetical protein